MASAPLASNFGCYQREVRPSGYRGVRTDAGRGDTSGRRRDDQVMRESYARDRGAGTTALRRVPTWVVVADRARRGSDRGVRHRRVVRATASATAQSATSADTVDIKDFSFSPKRITVKAGQPITVANEDNVTHTLTANNGAFDTGDLGGGSSRPSHGGSRRHVRVPLRDPPVHDRHRAGVP